MAEGSCEAKTSDQTGLVDVPLYAGSRNDNPPTPPLRSATQTLAEWGPPAWAQGAG